MKKKKYLMKIFMHLHAPLKERIQMVKDLGRSLDDKLAEGETIEGAIAELGEAADIIQEYGRSRNEKTNEGMGACCDLDIDRNCGGVSVVYGM